MKLISKLKLKKCLQRKVPKKQQRPKVRNLWLNILNLILSCSITAAASKTTKEKAPKAATAPAATKEAENPSP